MRVYFGLILSPSAGSVLASLSFRKGSRWVRWAAGSEGRKRQGKQAGQMEHDKAPKAEPSHPGVGVNL